MAKINDGTLTDFKDGDKMTSDAYEQDREILRVAINDNDKNVKDLQTGQAGLSGRVEVLEESDSQQNERLNDLEQLNAGSRLNVVEEEIDTANSRLGTLEGNDTAQDGKIGDLESSVYGSLAPSTFNGLSQMDMTYDQMRMGYVDSRVDPLVSQLAEIEKLTSYKNSHITSDLRITMHFNHTDETLVQENLNILKELGYNTLIISRNNTALTDVTGVSTNTLMEQFRNNGFNAILQVDYSTLISGGFSPVSNWIQAVDNNINIVGYWYQDEPFDRLLAKTDIELAYSRLKTMTNKPIFVTDPLKNLTNYTDKCFDILIWNLYFNANRFTFNNYNSEQKKFASFYQFMDLFKNRTNPPKKVIPMFPTFSQLDGNGGYIDTLPTIDDIDATIEFFKYTGLLSRNIATFMYHFYNNSPFDDLYNNAYLRFLSNYIMQQVDKSNPQDMILINADNYKTSKSFVRTDLNKSVTYSSLVLTQLTSGEIVLKFSKNGLYSNNKLFFRIIVHNNGDGKSKNLEVSTSYDDATYTVQRTYSYTPTSASAFPQNSETSLALNVNNNSDSVYVKFKIKNTDGTDLTAGTIGGVGIKSIWAGFL